MERIHSYSGYNGTSSKCRFAASIGRFDDESRGTDHSYHSKEAQMSPKILILALPLTQEGRTHDGCELHRRPNLMQRKDRL